MAKLEKQSVKPPPGQIKHDDHSVGTLDASSYDTKGTPATGDDEMFFGDGNLPTNYNITVDDKADIELGLKFTTARVLTSFPPRSTPMERHTTRPPPAPRWSTPPITCPWQIRTGLPGTSTFR